jgi:ketosteroid isomerase-like protein
VDVLVDENLIGTTGPDRKFETRLAVGAYHITVKKPGYQEQPPKPIEITKGKTDQVDFVLKPTSEPPKPLLDTYLLVTGRPTAIVAIDHLPVGTIPVSGTLSLKVEPKPHDVEVSLPGYKSFSKFVVPKRGDRLRVESNLFEIGVKDQYLIVQGPPGAQVDVDQHPSELIPQSGRLSVTVVPGIHSIEVNKEGYDVWQSNVQVRLQPGSSLSVVVDLKATARSTIPNSETHSQPPISANATDGNPPKPNPTTAINPSATVVPSAAVGNPDQLSLDDRHQILALLDRYAEAFHRKDLKEIKSSWPEAPPKKLNAIKESFKSNTELALLEPSLSLLPDDNLVMVTCQQVTSQKIDGQLHTAKRKMRFYVKKNATGWHIDNIPDNE